MKFESVKDFICFLIDNEGEIIADNYGREWCYLNYEFYFKDISKDSTRQTGLKCLHLYETEMHCKRRQDEQF